MVSGECMTVAALNSGWRTKPEGPARSQEVCSVQGGKVSFIAAASCHLSSFGYMHLDILLLSSKLVQMTIGPLDEQRDSC